MMARNEEQTCYFVKTLRGFSSLLAQGTVQYRMFVLLLLQLLCTVLLFFWLGYELELKTDLGNRSTSWPGDFSVNSVYSFILIKIRPPLLKA